MQTNHRNRLRNSCEASKAHWSLRPTYNWVAFIWSFASADFVWMKFERIERIQNKLANVTIRSLAVSYWNRSGRLTRQLETRLLSARCFARWFGQRVHSTKTSKCKVSNFQFLVLTVAVHFWSLCWPHFSVKIQNVKGKLFKWSIQTR